MGFLSVFAGAIAGGAAAQHDHEVHGPSRGGAQVAAGLAAHHGRQGDTVQQSRWGAQAGHASFLKLRDGDDAVRS